MDMGCLCRVGAIVSCFRLRKLTTLEPICVPSPTPRSPAKIGVGRGEAPTRHLGIAHQGEPRLARVIN